MKNSELPLYQPPRARDLSASSASGLLPQGMCIDGTALTSEDCISGPNPTGGDCSPTGISPKFGYCTEGNVAAEGCQSGGIHH